jgi:hypothetical protein
MATEDEMNRIHWEDDERGWHITIQIRDSTYSATGVTPESVLETLVLALADSIEKYMAHLAGDPDAPPLPKPRHVPDRHRPFDW